MNDYELMIKTNHYIIKNGINGKNNEFNESHKTKLVNQLLQARSTPEQAQRFYHGVKYPNNIDNEGRRMYPVFYIPPYNDRKKLQTVIPLSPKTHILSANSYELEIIRLLYLFAPNNCIIQDMVKQTLERLKTTCFGYHDCAVGECFHSALLVLRFLAAVTPYDNNWINKLIKFFKKHMDEKLNSNCHKNVLLYYWLCLSELPMEITESEILRYKERILIQINKSYLMNSDINKTYNPVMICVLRNTLSRLTEYAYIKNRQPYVNDKDGRLYFDMSEDINN